MYEKQPHLKQSYLIGWHFVRLQVKPFSCLFSTATAFRRTG